MSLFRMFLGKQTPDGAGFFKTFDQAKAVQFIVTKHIGESPAVGEGADAGFIFNQIVPCKFEITYG